MAFNYIQAIGAGFPSTQCHAPGDGAIYEDIIWDAGSPLPSKETLDQWILSNDSLVSDKKITVLAFRKRFSLTEKVNLELASTTNPDPETSIEQKTMAATLRVMMKDLETALYIDLEDPEVVNGLNIMESFQLIAPGRANEILTNPIMPSERPINIF